MATTLLDTTGLRCPIPVLKARKVVRSLEPGDTLEVLATDPGAVPDFEAFCEARGFELLEHTKDGGVFRFLIKITD
ncbi:MAG: sulfurtransferase TusA family protein [Pseudomonadota bacterium]